MQLDRRKFLEILFGGVAGIALNEAIPFNRVWSFPTQIKSKQGLDLASGPDLMSVMKFNMPPCFQVGDIIRIVGIEYPLVVTAVTPKRVLLYGCDPEVRWRRIKAYVSG